MKCTTRPSAFGTFFLYFFVLGVLHFVLHYWFLVVDFLWRECFFFTACKMFECRSLNVRRLFPIYLFPHLNEHLRSVTLFARLYIDWPLMNTKNTSQITPCWWTLCGFLPRVLVLTAHQERIVLFFVGFCWHKVRFISKTFISESESYTAISFIGLFNKFKCGIECWMAGWFRWIITRCHGLCCVFSTHSHTHPYS